MKVLIVSSEIVPFAKTGGLADVAGALSKALKEMGHDVRLLTPRYKKTDKKKFHLKELLSGIEVKMGGKTEKVDILESRIPGTKVPAYFVEHEGYFGSRDELYTVAGKDYEDNLERFSLFCLAAIEMMKKLDWQPDVIHCNDWQSALICAYLKVTLKKDQFFSRTATVYSIHNMGYQGTFPKEKLPLTGLGWDTFSTDGLEFYGNIALTKAGFVYADVINTVSETYAKEIQTPEFGHGLEGLMKHRNKDLYGIVNGIDYDLWDPATDKMITANYDTVSIGIKSDNKAALQKEQKLPEKNNVPMIGIISRLADQKGFDILAEAIEKIMHLRCQMVILGTGEPKYHDLFKKMREMYPEHIAINLGFDATLAQMIYAGSDMFLMPSRYEPCGLGQLISFKYGTIPIVRLTGGLADTVKEFDAKSGKGDGFTFRDYSAEALISAIKKAIETFASQNTWRKLQVKVMRYDYSWGSSAKKYIDLYRTALVKSGKKQ